MPDNILLFFLHLFFFFNHVDITDNFKDNCVNCINQNIVFISIIYYNIPTDFIFKLNKPKKFKYFLHDNLEKIIMVYKEHHVPILDASS